MIEITRGTLEELIIKILQKTYPVTINDIKKELNVSKKLIERTLQKLQVKGIVKLDILPDKIYIRLLRNDFSFIGLKRQKKFIKHKSGKRVVYEKKDEDDIMYS